MSYQILLIITGLFFLLFGVIRLSEKMQMIFSVRIRQYIKQLVSSRFKGIVLGALATAFFQSSSATTVLIVSMVSAGLIGFVNSLSLILGAGIGSTVTAQLVALKITDIAPLFIIIGILIWFLAKGKGKIAGEAIFYFGLLFFGLDLMGRGIVSFKDNVGFLDFFQRASNPLWGTLIGFLSTIIVQSSSVITGILVMLGQKGLITINEALPLILGANIGTTITAILASIGTGKEGKRAALSHFFFKFFGVIIVLIVFPLFLLLVKATSGNIGQQIANGHLLFNVFIAIGFSFCLRPFSELVKKIIPGKEKILPLWPEWLDKRLLSEPKKAFIAIEKELDREMALAIENYKKAVGLIFDYNKAVKRGLFYVDLVIDNLQKEIMRYLDGVSRSSLSIKQTVKLFCYSSMVDDIERIGDHVLNIAQLTEYKETGNVSFSVAAKKEIEKIQDLVKENLIDAHYLITRKSKKKIKAVFEREEKIDELVKKAKEHHLKRFYSGICLAMAGPIFNDMLVNFERISDHCTNIAEYAEQLS